MFRWNDVLLYMGKNRIHVSTIEGTVSCDTQEVTVTPVVPDKRSAVEVNGSPADTAVNLNIGDTVVDITVASPDGSKTQVNISVLPTGKCMSMVTNHQNQKSLTNVVEALLGQMGPQNIFLSLV